MVRQLWHVADHVAEAGAGLNNKTFGRRDSEVALSKVAEMMGSESWDDLRGKGLWR